jgi:uncharacterized protein YbjT (DUF2867 family)
MTGIKKVVIFGANGQIGKLLSAQLAKTSDFKPISVIRTVEQRPYFENLGIETRLLSLEDKVEDIATHLQGVDAVVFTAGARGNPPGLLAVDLDGAGKTVEAAERAQVKRYIIVSAYKAYDRNVWFNSPIKLYYIAKYYADQAVLNSRLDYTILQPARLLDSPGTGQIENVTKAETVDQSRRQIPREDVATSVVEALRNDSTIGKTLPLVSGEFPIGGVFKGLY